MVVIKGGVATAIIYYEQDRDIITKGAIKCVSMSIYISMPGQLIITNRSMNRRYI